MKKGKTSKLNIFDDAKCYYGTVDSKELKSIYLVLQTWIEPSDDYDKWNRIIGEIKRQILHTLLEDVDYGTFEKKQIVDLDLRTSGLQLKKKSFLNLEINLFLDKEIDFKSIILKNYVKSLIKNIYFDVLNRNEYFNFYLTKNGNSKPIKVKTEKV